MAHTYVEMYIKSDALPVSTQPFSVLEALKMLLTPYGGLSSSKRPLLVSRPLRTVRASFKAYRSSLSNALMRTQFHNWKTISMDLCMAVWMKQNSVARPIFSTMDLPNDMMAVPSCLLGDLLVADRAEPILLSPQAKKTFSTT